MMTAMRSIVACLALCACGSDAVRSDGGTDAFSFGDVAPVIDPFGDASLALRARALFAQTCSGGPESGCHSDGAAGFHALLDPDGGDTIGVFSTEMPSVLRVLPFHPEESYVYWKVSGDPRIDGGVMPLSTGFDPRVVALVGPWIEAGAP